MTASLAAALLARNKKIADSDEEDEELLMVDIRGRVLAAWFTEAQLMETIINVSVVCSCLEFSQVADLIL